MTYATQQNLVDRYGEEALIQLTDRAMPPAGAIDAAVVAKALAAADALIDTYVGRRYDLPLASVPPVLTQYAEQIAYYSLHRDHYPDDVREGYDDALKMLRDISTGTAVLDVAGSEPAANDGVQVASAERVFDRESLKGF